MLPITDMLLTSQINRSGKKIITQKGVVMHWTANTGYGANAVANRNYFNTTTTYASAHYIVDDHSIVRCIPDDEVAWHVGASSYTALGNALKEGYTPNYFLIGIEMCVNSDGDWNKTYQYSAELAASLLKKSGLGVDKLYRHYDITGKLCPQMMIDEGEWAKFKQVVSNLMAPPTPSYTVQYTEGVIKVTTASGLNVRTSPDSGIENKVGLLNQGQTAQVIGKTDTGWYQILYNGAKTFVSANTSYSTFTSTYSVLPEDLAGVKEIVGLPVGFDEYLVKVGRRILHNNRGTYIDMDQDGIRFYVNGNLVRQFTSSAPAIFYGMPESKLGVTKYDPLPVGWNEYLYQSGRRIIHLNNGTYISLDPDGIHFYVNGASVGGFTVQTTPIVKPLPTSTPGVDEIVPMSIGYDEYLPQSFRRIIHLNAGTYISLDANAIYFYVNGQCVGQFA